MDEIRRIREALKYYNAKDDWGPARGVLPDLDRLESILPPEGEPRACVKCADWDASINKCARNNVVGMAGPSNPAECGPDHPHWTPAPSSEKALIDCIPSNWLDPLLTGPSAVVHDSPASEIEALLNGVRDRIKALLASSPAPSNKGAPDGPTD